jgi:hypothetical protein
MSDGSSSELTRSTTASLSFWPPREFSATPESLGDLIIGHRVLGTERTSTDRPDGLVWRSGQSLLRRLQKSPWAVPVCFWMRSSRWPRGSTPSAVNRQAAGSNPARGGNLRFLSHSNVAKPFILCRRVVGSNQASATKSYFPSIGSEYPATIQIDKNATLHPQVRQEARLRVWSFPPFVGIAV